MELILIRHGLPERRDDTSDPPLSDRGHDQARRVAAWLEAEPIHAVYASTMLRARQTAEPFAARAGHQVTCHDGICEFDRESGAYIPMETLKREDRAAWLRMATGEHSVDIGTFQKAVVDTLDGIIDAHPGQRVAVFCHGGVINVWSAHVLGMPARLFFEPDYTSIHRFMCARTGQRNVLALNERAHLRA
ncbi:histidine phosphatase family protein [Phenylobacterium kunshanense]|uniref:histidine phosphatase family protein n=1 Tax=Phenylobacterium kunshanense TaxID=1445034 RepID=UPI0014020458|nr:histidine phosphatase family protein [Phenylobacterium kunshanense]